MTYRIIIEPTAAAGIREAYRYRFEKSPAAAEKWRLGLLKAIATLQTHPHRCPVADESDDFEDDFRVLLYGKRRGVYRVLFTIHEDVVSVLYVRHGAQGPLTS
jgi:plasmid stabilization system protein ParE